MAKESSGGFTADERAAMKARAAEMRAEKAREKSAARREEALQGVLDAIAAMGDADRALAERIHAIVGEVAPQLEAKTWYGMPAYTRDGKVVCFFKAAEKFKGRYATFGFEDAANLDDGSLWPTSYALLGIDDDVEAQLRALIARAAAD